MRLRRRKPPAISTGRRQRRPADPASKRSGMAYRSRRSEEELNTGRQLSRDPAAGSRSRSGGGLGRFVAKRFGLIILLITLLFSAVNVLRLSDQAHVMSLTGSGGDSFLHDKAVYETAADKLLAKSVWNRNKITIDTGAVSKGMLEQFPELSSVSVTLPLLSQRPIVYIQTAQPALILSASNGSYIIDTSGKALLQADKLPNGSDLRLPTVTDQSGLRVTLNHQALTSGDVSFILTVIGQLNARHVAVSAMDLPIGTSELDVHIAGQPYIVKFNLQSGDARQQAGTFLATQSQLQKQNVTPSQYIDVRVDGRAYYK
jgi:cell division septal protein FtsQ